MADIRNGSSGQAVTMVQQRLKELGYHLTVDGVFGPVTETAVTQYQDEHGLAMDGVVGMKTITKLFPEKVPQYVPPTRHKVIDLTLLQVLERANGCINAPVKYHLEYPNGGTDPDSNMPCDEATGFLDCSGFNAWVQGFDRDFEDGLSRTLDGWDGYANTDSKIEEAEKEGLLFTIHDTPEVGDMIVGETFRRPLALKRTIGHEGTIVAVDNWAKKGLAGLAVVHCSPSNYKYGPSAIFKTNGLVWSGYPKVRFLRFNRAYAIGKSK